MAAERRDPRGLEAADPASDHDDPLPRRRGLDVSELGLPAGARVLDAGDGLALIDAVDAPLVRADALADLVEPTLAGLPRHVGVRDERAGHADHVHRAVGQDLVRVHGVDDARGVEDRDLRHGRLDRRRQRDVHGVRERHVRHGAGLEREGVGGAPDDREEVDEAGGGEPVRDLRHVVGRQAAVGELVSRDPGADHVVGADLPADLAEDLEPEAHPVLEAPAVLVRPLVEDRGPELVDQVVVGERELDPVEPALAAPPHGVPERAHEHRDLLGLELVRDLPVDALRDLGRREEDVPALVVRLGAPAHVGELGEDEAPVTMDGLRHRAVGGDDRVVVVRGHVPRARRGGGVDARRAAEDRERATAARLALVVRAEPGPGLPVLGHGLGVPGGEDAVPEGQASDADRREQIAKLVCHGSPGTSPARRARSGRRPACRP